jgi:predicted AlkP superfamily phosphohydrolase/phosphomutase
VVYDWYRRLDRFVGDVSQKVEQWNGKYRYLLLSDHGFSDFRKKVHLNRWLVEHNYLCMKNDGQDLNGVEWSKTKAYAVGLNSIYLNISGRERQGCVSVDEIEKLLADIQSNLSDWKDEQGESIVQKVRLKHETFNGPFTRFGPDLVVGYAPGYRASAETGLGKVPPTALEPNNEHWGADHCIEADAVPGVIFANRNLAEFGGISFRDLPFLAIGKHLDQSQIKPPSQAAGEGQKDVEERLKGLGYL